MREINTDGLNLLKASEGCRLTAYKDQRGIWTIGYGSAATAHPEICEGMTITQDQAELYLKKDLENFYHLDQYLSEQVNDNQFSALVCLVYNIGLKALKTSTLIKAINDDIKTQIKSQWLSWDHVNGVEDQGLLNRRKAELALYFKLG
jgi:lysozyme